MRRRFMMAGCFVLSLAGAETSVAKSRIDVPIKQTILPNGDVRYSAPISVNGGPAIEAALDTGSFGLRVLSSAVRPEQYEATSNRRHYPFGSGARLNGFLAKAPVAVGDLRTDQPILFQVVESVDCVEAKPNCPAARLSAEEYRIAGDGYAGVGFNAILGISMRTPPVAEGAFNPLTAMGIERWIVVFPRPGESSGHLIVNPTTEERAGFTTVHLQRQNSGWTDGALSGCFVEERTNAKYCGKTIIDSGAPGVFVASNKAVAGSQQDERWRFELRGGSKRISFSFTSGNDYSSKVTVQPAHDTAGARISAGNLPYLYFEVLYDAAAGTIGFKPRGTN